MNEMIEWVARAIYETEPHLNQGVAVPWPELSKETPLRSNAYASARAAIAAMREPTKDMVQDACAIGEPSVEEIWEAMIDAALSS